MSSKKKFQYNDEIDLAEIIFIIWNNKSKVILITSFAVITMLFYLLNQPIAKLSYRATTEIRPISTFDEFEYEIYNNYLKNSETQQLNYSIVSNKENAKIRERLIANIDNSSFDKIDKLYLLNLFKDTLNENSIFIKAIKKFQLIKKENYETDLDYENAIIKLASSIQLIALKNKKNNETTLNIQFETQNKENWEKFLRFLEKTANLKIQKYLNDTFNILVTNQKMLKEFKIEDINILISSLGEDKEQLEFLKKRKKNLFDNKNIERLENVFQSTPIVKSKGFYAAKMMVESTKYENLTKQNYQIFPMLLLSGLIGVIISIFYVLFANSIQNQKRKLSEK